MNQDHQLVIDCVAGGELPRPITSNPLARSLHASLLDVSAEAGTVTLAFQPDAAFAQGAGIVQGGIIAAMLDFAAAFAAFTQLPPGDSFGTASMSVNFLSAAAPGKYLARGRLVRLGGRIVFAETALNRAADDRLVATASFVMARSASTPPSR